MRTEESIEIEVEQLMPNMVIANDLMNNGTLLLKKGSVLDEVTIEKIKTSYLEDKVSVYVSDEVFGEERKGIEKKEVERVFREVSDDLKNLFISMKTINEDSVAELKEFVSKIERQLQRSEIVLNRVLFKGNDGDCIYRHGVNVAVLSALLAKWVGFDEKKVNSIIYAALLHDFGITKLDIDLQIEPDLISVKKNDRVQEHIKIAYNSIKSVKALDQSVTYGVLMHHERWDGSGYPLKLEGEKIHPFARIIAIADEFDVLNSDGEFIYKNGVLAVLREIKEKSLNYFDYSYTKTFLEHISDFCIGETVELSNGDEAKVLQMNIHDFENPLLLKGDEFVDLKSDKNLYVKNFVFEQ